MPAWITFDNASAEYTIITSSTAEIGEYTVTTMATIAQIDSSTGNNQSISHSFTLNVVSDCVNTIITDKTLSAMTIFVTQSST